MIHVVRSGDNLYRIARRYGVTVESIVIANRIKNPNLIYVGQQLRIWGKPVQASVRAFAKKGLAMATYYPEDLLSLKVSWYYTWGWNTQALNGVPAVPMCRSFEMPREQNVPYLLIGNEPNAIEPYGRPTTPKEAALLVFAIERNNPLTRMVVGNVAADDWRSAGGWGSGVNWLKEFRVEYRKLTGRVFVHALGIHVYAQDSAMWALDRLREYRKICAGEIWLTEFGVLSGNTNTVKTIMDYAMANFDRVAAYTNRQPHTGQGWEIGTGVELVNGDGTLTPSGIVFAGM